MTLREVLKHIGLETLGTFFKDRAFFNRIMAAVALAQAIRLWQSDVMFDVSGYQWLQDHIQEEWYAILPFTYFAGVAFRAYTRKWFFGRVWFWRVNQFTNVVGAVHFSVPALSISYSLHTVGMQSLGYIILATAMVAQIFVTAD